MGESGEVIRNDGACPVRRSSSGVAFRGSAVTASSALYLGSSSKQQERSSVLMSRDGPLLATGIAGVARSDRGPMGVVLTYSQYFNVHI